MEMLSYLILIVILDAYNVNYEFHDNLDEHLEVILGLLSLNQIVSLM